MRKLILLGDKGSNLEYFSQNYKQTCWHVHISKFTHKGQSLFGESGYLFTKKGNHVCPHVHNMYCTLTTAIHNTIKINQI